MQVPPYRTPKIHPLRLIIKIHYIPTWSPSSWVRDRFIVYREAKNSKFRSCQGFYFPHAKLKAEMGLDERTVAESAEEYY